MKIFVIFFILRTCIIDSVCHLMGIPYRHWEFKCKSFALHGNKCCTESYKMCLLTKCSWRWWLCLCFHLHILLFYCFVSKFLTRIFVMVLTSLIYCDNIWKHLPVEILYLHVLAGIKITILLPTLLILPLFIQARDKNVIEIRTHLT